VQPKLVDQAGAGRALQIKPLAGSAMGLVQFFASLDSGVCGKRSQRGQAQQPGEAYA
jgi:hypothetical protein